MAPFAFPARARSVASSALEKRFSYHSNDVIFQVKNQPSNNVDGIVGGLFTVNGVSVSSGQDPKGYNRVGNPVGGQVVKGGTQFSFQVGRHGTSQVANWWNTVMPPSQNTFGHTAGDLNFAFTGTLTLNYVTVPPPGEAAKTITVTFQAGLAQGHNGSNNWWFGAQNSRLDPNNQNQLMVTGIDTNKRNSTWTFLRGGNGDNTITVTQIEYQTCLPDGTWETTMGLGGNTTPVPKRARRV